MNFAEKFCAERHVPPEDFEATVLRLTLRPTARWLRPLLNLNPNYFGANREFIRGVGRISRLADFESDAQDFAHNPNGRDFLHRQLGLRVSRRRLRNLVRATLAD